MKPQFITINIATDGAIALGHSEALAGLLSALVRADRQFCAMPLPAGCRAALRVELLESGQAMIASAGEVAGCFAKLATVFHSHQHAASVSITE